MRFFLLLLAIMMASPAGAEEKQSFAKWLADFRIEAQEKGISQKVLDDAFADLPVPSDEIVMLDHKQPEISRTFAEYIQGTLTAKKIAAARKAKREHRKVLHRIERKYGVPASIIVALWGSESNFGKNQGNYFVIDSLATLAYDGRRSVFFRKELLDALEIMQDEGISHDEMTGSWAGAMGQTQFMPSSYLRFAVDFDHDGEKDIWNSDTDALASIANYLKIRGWRHGGGWGMKGTHSQ